MRLGLAMVLLLLVGAAIEAGGLEVRGNSGADLGCHICGLRIYWYHMSAGCVGKKVKRAARTIHKLNHR